MVYNNQYLYKWHIDRSIFPNERLTKEDAKPVGYFVYHQSKWLLVNQTMDSLKLVKEDQIIKKNETVELKEGVQLLFSDKPSSRLAAVQIVN